MQKLKKGLLVLLAIIVVAGVSTGITFTLIKLTGKEPLKLTLGQPTQKGKVFGPILDVGEFTQNIKDSAFLKVQISLELADKKYEEPIKTLLPVVKDKIIGVLSTKSLDDINNSNGKENLRQELLKQINEALGAPEVKNVLFTSFVYQ